MNPALIAQLLGYGVQYVPIVIKLIEDFKEKRTETTVTVDDLKELQRLNGLTLESIFAAQGVAPPPVAVIPAA